MAAAHIRRLFLLLASVWLCAALLLRGLAQPLFAPPPADERQLFLLMGFTGSASILIAWLIRQLGLIQRLRSLRYSLMLLSLLTILTLFANFWLLARQMFLDAHDLGLSAVLLVFGAWTALGSGYFISNAFTPRIRTLAHGADRLAHGELTTRVAADGQDELAALARSFNMMAARLEEAAAQRARLEQGRRDLIAWTSHDLRTPLASLRLVIEALVDGVAGDAATQQRYLETRNGKSATSASSSTTSSSFRSWRAATSSCACNAARSATCSRTPSAPCGQWPCATRCASRARSAARSTPC